MRRRQFTATDGTVLAYEVHGEAGADTPPLVCIPGGAMRDPVYLGDLGGLCAHRQLVVLHLRGTGASAVPRDPATYRCDRQVPDVEALRAHLGLERIELLAHSAGAGLALLYAAAHPERVAALTLVTPSLRALGLGATAEDQAESRLLRAHEPWFDEAVAALKRIDADEDNASIEDWLLYARFSYGRWDEEIERYERASEEQYNEAAAGQYNAPGAFDPDLVRAGLARLSAPVLLLAAEYDGNPLPRVAAVAAGSFPSARLAVQPGAGHFPWIDDPAAFVRLLTQG
jgi:pimeloyl-ACP methyl ester carboxylesterase